MKLRTNLVALVLAAVVPIVLFATVVVVLLWRTDRRGTEERLRNTARAQRPGAPWKPSGATAG